MAIETVQDLIDHLESLNLPQAALKVCLQEPGALDNEGEDIVEVAPEPNPEVPGCGVVYLLYPGQSALWEIQRLEDRTKELVSELMSVESQLSECLSISDAKDLLRSLGERLS